MLERGRRERREPRAHARRAPRATRTCSCTARRSATNARADPQRRAHRPHHHPRARGRDHHRQGLREARRASPSATSCTRRGWRSRTPIVPRELIRGVAERVDVDGDVVVRAATRTRRSAAIDELVAEGVEAIAVSLLWSFVNDAHEQRVGELLARARARRLRLTLLAARSRRCSASTSAPRRPRSTPTSARRSSATSTTSSGACASEGLARPAAGHAGQRRPHLRRATPRAGRSSRSTRARPAASSAAGTSAGCTASENVICTDMGGTSFDVGLILRRRGRRPTPSRSIIAVRRAHPEGRRRVDRRRRRLASPGSTRAALLRVGPQSAGAAARARPVTAAAATEPTVTDADLVLGYLNPDDVPRRADEARPRRSRSRRSSGSAGRSGMERRGGRDRGLPDHQRPHGRPHPQVDDRAGPRPARVRRSSPTAAPGRPTPPSTATTSASKAILVPRDSTAFSAEGMLTCDVTHTEQASRQLMTPLADEDLAAMTERFVDAGGAGARRSSRARASPRRGRDARRGRSASATGCRSTRSTSTSTRARSTSGRRSCCARASPSATAISTARARCSAAGRWSRAAQRRRHPRAGAGPVRRARAGRRRRVARR